MGDLNLFRIDWTLEGGLNRGFVEEDYEFVSPEDLDPFNIKVELYEAS